METPPARVIVCVLLGFVLSACGIPKDPEGTLARVRSGVMRVGVAENEPWTAISDEGEPSGVEVTLVERFADSLGTEIEWHPGTEAELMAALSYRELDLVIGGLTSTAPWVQEATFTHPYITTQVLVAVPEPDEVPEDIAGVRVAAERGSEALGILRKTDAIAVAVDDLAAATGAVAIDHWLLDDLGLVDTGVRLLESDHVFAVPHGENAWLVEIERFLLERPAEIKELLDEQVAL